MSDTPETEALDAKIVQLLADAIKNNTPLSEMIGVVITMHVNLQKKLEHERNEARAQHEHWRKAHGHCSASREVLIAERDQLRKVADELESDLKSMHNTYGFTSDSLESYNSLPHVIERNKVK